MTGLCDVLTRKLWNWYKGHEGDVDAHHTKYTDADVVSAIEDNGTYFKDNDICMNTNFFGGRRLYINSNNNAYFRADKRWVVTGNYYNKSDDSLYGSITNVKNLFDGNYDSSITILPGKYALININFSNEIGGIYPDYAYGTYYISNYHIYFPTAATTNTDTVRVYCNYAPHTIGWHSYNFADFLRTSYLITHRYVVKHKLSEVEFKLHADDSNSRRVTQIDMSLTRPATNEMPIVDKFKANTLYDKLTITADTLGLTTAKTPSSASDTGNPGDICWDVSYVYVCTATNTWKRTPLSTW